MSNYQILGSIVGHHHHHGGGGNWGAGGGWWPWGPGAPDMYWSRPYYVGPIDEIDDTVVVEGLGVEGKAGGNVSASTSGTATVPKGGLGDLLKTLSATPAAAAESGTSHKDTVAERPYGPMTEEEARGPGAYGQPGGWTPEQRTAAVAATKAANDAAKPESTLKEKVAAMPTWKKALLGGLAAVAVVAVGGGVVAAVRR